MPKILINCIDYFVPESLRTDLETLYKTRVFIGVNIFVLGMCVFMYFATQNVEMKANAEYPFFLSMSINLVALYMIKNRGAIFLMGNLFGAVTFFTLVFLSFKSGGIYSTTIRWTFLVPLLVFVMVDVKSGLFWSGMVLLYCMTMFYLDVVHYIDFREQLYDFDNTFFLYDNISLFLFILGIFYLFWLGRRTFAQAVQKNSLEVAAQKIEIEKQSERLKKIQHALLDSNQALQQYGYVVSHDLKQPLRSIKSFSEILKQHYTRKGELDDASKEYFDFIKEGTERMEQFIVDLLQFSKLNNSLKEDTQSVNLNQVLEIVKNNLHQQIKDNNVEFKYGKLPTIDGVEVYIVQLFQNLISNSIKFRREEACPEIEIVVEELNNHWFIKLKDNGIGMEEKNVEKIFQPFKRLHSQDKYEGSGIGLASCQKIITKHEGKIWAESVFGEGTSFCFTIKKELQSESSSQILELNELEELNELGQSA